MKKDPVRQERFINNSWITIGSKWKGINTRQDNFVVSILASHWGDLKDIHQTNWPRTFYLQVDNCWRENKNITMFSFLGTLILRDWFDKVYLFSLLLGHTHEDIDQMFSIWNVHY